MRQPIFLWCAFLLLFSFFYCFPFFDFRKHTRQRRPIRGRSAQSRGRRNPENGVFQRDVAVQGRAIPRGGDQGTGAIQKKAGAWGMASGREMVAAIGLEEKKTMIEHKVTSNN